MAIIKCPSCGHRNFSTSLNCTNCGAPLVEQLVNDGQAIISYEQPQPPVQAIPQLPQVTPQKPPAASTSNALQTYTPNSPTVAQTPITHNNVKVSPYQTYDYTGIPNIPQTIIHEEAVQIPGTEPWETARYPWWFPRKRPDIVGVVIQSQGQQELVRTNEIGGSIVRVIRDIIWPMPADTASVQQREKETIFVTTVRVRTPEGIQRDARIQGHLTGTNISLGDKIALWGWKRRGTLLVRAAYNHTAQGVVTTPTMKSPLPTLIIMALLLIGLIYLALTFHLPALHIPTPPTVGK